MSDQPATITPKTVPLTHTGALDRNRRSNSRTLIVGVVLALAAALVVALFAWAPRLVAPQPATGAAHHGPASESGEVANIRPRPASDEPPPFAALRRQQARTEAQDELARFVELEIALRDTMRSEGWADTALEAAKNLALEGDEAFVAEGYAEAIEQYRAAANALATLIAEGQDRFATALAAALQAVEERNPDAAEASLAQARLVKPEHPELLALAARAERLPEIIKLFREAHNQELTENWDDAIATYARIRTLDPATPGLDQAVATARQQQSAQRLQALLSSGFAQLSSGRLDEAQSTFNQALGLDRQNGAALGGLQQVQEQRLVGKIERLGREARQAAAKEDWPAAAAAFEAILALDANIQFARAGLAEASQQAATIAALQALGARAETLSSDQRYAEAQATLALAKALEPRGPVLNAAITIAQALLDAHATPVPVVLQSDNATEVLLSHIGSLGKFSELRLDLRPGAYTLIGSRDGCRDVRTTIRVHTDMPPVDIRCQVRLSHQEPR